MATYPIRNRHWTRKEYDQLIKIGFFHADEPIELLGGHLIVAEPKGTPHSTAIALTGEALRWAFVPGWPVRVQDPVALDDESEPEPDVVVVPGSPRDYLAEHPVRPAVLVEVAESRLGFDRGHKGSLYARAGVADYWIVNLVDRVVEVRRRPAPDPGADFGAAYQDIELARPGATLTPLAKPEARVAVDDLLP